MNNDRFAFPRNSGVGLDLHCLVGETFESEASIMILKQESLLNCRQSGGIISRNISSMISIENLTNFHSFHKGIMEDVT